MLTREDAQAIYRAGEETVVRALLDLSANVDRFTADFAALKRVFRGTPFVPRIHTS